jgi:DNA-binding HxlR family transcriptional regulator
MGAGTPTATEQAEEPAVHATQVGQRSPCCALYHHAVELVGRRWTGAILLVLMDGPLRFSEIRHLVPDVSDRLLSERLKELESEGVVERRVYDETPVRVEYGLTPKGQALEPALNALKSWSHDHCSIAPSEGPGASGDCR